MSSPGGLPLRRDRGQPPHGARPHAGGRLRRRARPTPLYSWTAACVYRLPEALPSALLSAAPLLAPLAYEAYARRLGHAAAVYGNLIVTLLFAAFAVSTGGVSAIPAAVGLAAVVSTAAILTAKMLRPAFERTKKQFYSLFSHLPLLNLKPRRLHVST